MIFFFKRALPGSVFSAKDTFCLTGHACQICLGTLTAECWLQFKGLVYVFFYLCVRVRVCFCVIGSFKGDDWLEGGGGGARAA